MKTTLMTLLILTLAACSEDGENPQPDTGPSDASPQDAAPDAVATADGSDDDATTGDTAPGDTAPGDSVAADGNVTNKPAVLTSVGDPAKVLLKGIVLSPTQSFQGEVLVEGDLLTCVAISCAGEPGAASASVVQTNGVILPGLIDTNSQIQYRAFDGADWTPATMYTNHKQWTGEPRYAALLAAKQHLAGEGGSPVNLSCELNKYGEIQALIAGTTSVIGKSTPANKPCYRTLARTIDQSANGLCAASPGQGCADRIQAHTLMPSTSSADSVCDAFDTGDTDAYLVQLAEGTDQDALDEWSDLYVLTSTDGCLFDARTTLVHGTALGSAELGQMAGYDMGLSWSPRSNVALFGGGTDLSKTADIPAALAAGVTVSLSTGFPPVASPSLLAELRFADTVDNTQWGDKLSAKALLEMATVSAAKQLALDTSIGSLAPGLKADLVVVGGDTANPYQAALDATPRDVRLVMVNGAALYGDSQLQPLGPASPGCEIRTICGHPKFICAAVSGQPAQYLLDQTLADIESTLSAALQAYDNLDLSPWDFHPLAPLAVCP